MDKKLFKERLRIARKEKGLSQAQLADLVKIAQNTVSSYERDGGIVPGVDIAVALADELNVSLDWLTGRTQNKERINHISGEEFLEHLLDTVSADCVGTFFYDNDGKHHDFLELGELEEGNGFYRFFLKVQSRDANDLHEKMKELAASDNVLASELSANSYQTIRNALKLEIIKKFSYMFEGR